MKIIIENIYNDLLEISDLSLQEKLWLNRNNSTGRISSYTELVCRLFDDNNIDNFIKISASENGFSAKIVSELNLLRNKLNEYEGRGTDEEIINDPKWKEISEQASKVIEEWDTKLCS